jgi:ribosomal-protein-alanine N-acetyltransferase
VSEGVAIGRATRDDLVGLAEVEAASASQPWTPGQLEDEMGAPGGEILVARARGARSGAALRVVAYCACRVVLDEASVMNVAVASEWRRRGLARLLLRTALRRAARAGARRAFLEVREGNLAAIALYESLGFTRVGLRRRYYRDPLEDGIVMARQEIESIP